MWSVEMLTIFLFLVVLAVSWRLMIAFPLLLIVLVGMIFMLTGGA